MIVPHETLSLAPPSLGQIIPPHAPWWQRRWACSEIAAIGACCLLAIGLGFAAQRLTSAREQATAQIAQRELERTADRVAIGIDRHIQFIEGLHELAALSMSNGPQARRIRDRIEILADRAKALVTSVVIIDAAGHVAWSSAPQALLPDSIGDPASILPLFRSGDDVRLFTGLPEAPGGALIYHGRILRGANEARIGLSLIGTRPDDLLEQIEMAASPLPGLRLTYIRRDGTVFAAADSTLRGTVLDSASLAAVNREDGDLVAFAFAANREILVRAELPGDFAMAHARRSNRSTWIIVSGAVLVSVLLAVLMISRNIADERMRVATAAREEDARIHAMLRDLSANLRDGIALIDERPGDGGRLTFWTEACTTILGTSTQEVPQVEQIPASLREVLRQGQAVARETGTPWNSEFLHVHPSKGQRVIEVGLQIARAEETGRDSDRILVSLRDVTEQRHAVAEVARSANRLRTLLSGLPGRVFEVEVMPTYDGSYLFSNAFVAGGGGLSFTESADESINSLNSNTWFQHYDEDAKAAMVNAIRQAIIAGEAVCEYWFTRDGTRYSYRLSVRCVRRWDNKALICGYGWDITQEEAMLESLSHSMSLISLGEMAAGIMHELNQPLTVISLLATNALNTLSIPAPNVVAAREKLNRVLEQTMRAADIVKYVRKLGRPDDDFAEPIDVGASIREAVSFLSARLRDAGIEVMVQIDGDLGVVHGNTVAFQQVLINLTCNSIDAIEAMPANRGKREVRITAARHGTNIEIEHSDSGGGILDDRLSKVFNPFFTTKDVGKGTGLGLSLAHRTIHAMRGSIEVGNRGDGASFTIRLPATIPAMVAA